MSKMRVKLGGKYVTIDTNKKKVVEALAALVQACATPEYPIGMIFEHANGDEYLLSRILQRNGTHRAYLLNIETGVARNSDKVVLVQDAKGGGTGRGYVETLPARKDKFYDPDGSGDYIDID